MTSHVSDQLWHEALGDSRRYTTGWHAHDSAMLLLPQRGPMICQFADERDTHRLHPGDVLAVGPRVMHRTVSEISEAMLLCLYPTSRLPTAWTTAHEAFCIAALPSPLLALLDYHAAVPARSHRARLAEELILAEALSLTPPPSARDHGRALALAVATHLRTQLHEPHALDDLARHFGLSRRHLTRLFRKHVGTSITTYLSEQRVHAAAHRIATGEDVTSAAAAVGIQSPSHLARLFRRFEGRSPIMARSGRK